MKIAIASSGLGHVARGIEAWALSLADGLARCDAGDLEVTLFAGAPLADAVDGTLRVEALNTLKRSDWRVRWLARLAPRFTWRWGWRAPYAMEQISFARQLIHRLRTQPVDVVHTQDVVLAHCLQRAVRRQRITTRIILAHGTDETAAALQGLPVIQHLAPVHRERLAPGLPDARHFVIPNFVDCHRFSPPSPSERDRLRRVHGIPPDAVAIGYSGALRQDRKRFQTLIDEVGDLADAGVPVFLLAAGAGERDTAACLRQAEQRLPGRHWIGVNLPFHRMPDLYRSMDLAVHPAPAEFFGICLLEAMACGVPVVVHQDPVLSWIAGEGGWFVDVERPGFLGGLLRVSGFERLRAEKAQAARAQVEKTFSWEAVCPAFLSMYRAVGAGSDD